MITVTLAEPVRLRDTEANEESKLSEFRKELAQLAAVLRGDHESGYLSTQKGRRHESRRGC